MNAKIVNFVAFQVVWFATLFGAAGGRPWLGPCVLAAALAVHLVLRRRASSGDVALLCVAAIVGYVADSALTLAGVIAFPPATQLGGPSPLWMVGLWVNFATTLRLSLAWLVSRPGLAALLGVVGGPLAYGAGYRMGAIELPAGITIGLLAVAAEYAVSLPVLGWVAGRTGTGGGRVATAGPAGKEVPT